MAAAPNPGALQQQAAVMDGVYGPWTGTGWRPRPFERVAPRYLWTDAFGVCNYLSLYQGTHNERYLQQATALVQDVHNTLGHQRGAAAAVAAAAPSSAAAAAAAAAAWLPGASEQHPTAGGLRIGKKHPEGHPDGDGQYFHYLTKWAFALAAMTAATGDPTYLGWAVEMVQHIHPAFVYQASRSGPKRMHWKMSTDLQRALVPSMGNLDPYDGLVTYTLLQQQADKRGVGVGPVLVSEISDMRDMVDQRYSSYSSDDPLDLGEALWLSHWQLGAADWADHISAVSLASLDGLWREGYFEQPLQWRLGFREFGTSIGLQALLAVRPTLPAAAKWQARVADLHGFWGQHLTTRDNDITPVMYATSLNPGVWLKTNWDM